MDTTAADDKMQAVVKLVLQAVDQRLESLREQLLQASMTIATNHSELSQRIDECHRLCEAIQREAPTAQLVASVASLTDRLALVEAEAEREATARIGELTAAIAAVSAPVLPVMSVPPLVSTPPTVPAPAATTNTGPIFARRPAATIPAGTIAAEPPRVAPVLTAVPSAPAEPSMDIAALNAQISARLAAAVDRALGELTANDVPEPSSNTG